MIYLRFTLTESEDMETNRNLKQPDRQTEPLKLAILALDRVASREKSPVEWIGILEDHWTASDT